MNARAILVAALVALSPLAGAQAPAPKPAPKAAAAPVAAPAAAPLPPPAGPIGSVALVTGSVTAGTGGQARALGAGDPLMEGQTIVVGPNSYASLKFNDGGRVLLRPNTEFVVESFRTAAALAPAAAPAAATGVPAAAPPPVSGNAFFRLVRGGFRAVTGLIGKADRADYRVSTPAATIGIRGTDFEVVTCTDDCPSQARAAAGHAEVASNSLEGLELAQAGTAGGATGSGGIVVATHEGAIVLRTAQGETVVNVGQVALALGTGQTFMLPRVPDLMLQTPVPAPAACE